MTEYIKLPPLPYPQIPGNDYDPRDMRDYARAAIAPYKKRITELEADLEAIGAGGVSARRITSTPANASAKITERSQAYLDSNLDVDEHAAFISWAREAHDYPDYARLILDSEWCQGAVAGWQGAIEADRQQRREPVVLATYHAIVDESEKHIMHDTRTNQLEIYDEREDAVKAAPDHLSVVPVYVTATEGPLYAAPQPAAPAQEPTNDEIREVFLANGFTIKDGRNDLMPYVYDAARALLAQYSQPVEPEDWQLVPKELIDFLDAKEHHLPVEDRHVLSIMLKAAPKFGEEE